MNDLILTALISAGVGGLLVAIVNHLFIRKKTSAEVMRIYADAEKIRAETEKINLEILQLKAIHSNSNEAEQALANAIRESKDIVYIMGISLRQFFGSDSGDCAQALRDIYRKSPNCKFKILLLDPNSEDARSRAIKEEAVASTGTKEVLFAQSKLYHDIQYSLSSIPRVLPTAKVRLQQNNILFLLITDRSIFVQGYHYAVVRNKANVPIIMEWQKTGDESAYEQYLEHFDRIFSHALLPAETDSEEVD